MTFRLLLYPHTMPREEQLEDATISTTRLHALYFSPPFFTTSGLDWKAAEPTATGRPDSAVTFPTPSSPCAHNTGSHHLAYRFGRKDSRPHVSTSRSLGDETQRLTDSLQSTGRFDLPSVSPINCMYLQCRHLKCVSHLLFPAVSAATEKPDRSRSWLAQ